MDGINLGGGDAQLSSPSNKATKRPRKSRDRGWIAPKFTPRSSRRSASSRSFTYVTKSDAAQVRAPWVPAPAKSTSSVGLGDAFFGQGPSSSHQHPHSGPIPNLQSSPNPISAGSGTTASSSSSPSGSPNQPLKPPMASAPVKAKSRPSSSHTLFANATSTQNTLKEGHHVRRSPASKVKSNRPGSRRGTPGYSTLQSKDSLVDVTACLQEKRDEVMKMWQHNLQNNDDPTLITKIENVNKLALEAAEEVEFLRRTIQTLQKKTEGLSEEDCTHLNELRAKVLSKVKEFEEADKALQGTIVRKSSSKASIASATSQTSRNEHEHDPVGVSETAQLPVPVPIPDGKILSSHSLKDLVFLKEKSESYFDDYKSDNEEEVLLSAIQPPFLSDRSTLASGAPSMENLSHLKMRYGENLEFPRSQEGIRLARSQSYNIGLNTAQHHDHQQHRKIRFAKEKTSQVSHSDGEIESLPDTIISADELYREKISHLQRKLMNTEQEVEELKSDMERIESDANFRVRMLQNSVQDKFESLKSIPDYFQMVDVKMTESIHVKMQLQRDLHEKDRLLHEEKEHSKNFRKEADELREKLRVAENLKEFQAFKNAELEKANHQLKKEAEETAKLTAELVGQVKMLKDREATFTSPRSPRVSAMENQRLKMKCSELKEELAQAKRIIQTLKKSKAKLVCDSNQRIEELLQTLQTAQHHKRILGDQIRLLKKSYNELFPCNCQSHAIVPHMCNELPKSNKTKKKATATATEPEPVDEPLIESKDAWRTGEGILLENLLDLPLDYLTLKTNKK